MPHRRIVIVNDTSVARGGATVLALMAARALVARGHEVLWLCGDAGDNPELIALGIEVIALNSQPLLDMPPRRAFVSGIHHSAAAAMVADFVATRDTPDTVYHVHSWAQIFSPTVFAALAPVAGRVLIHAHDMFLACPNGVFMDYRHQKVCTRVPLSPGCIVTNCDKRNYAQKLWRVARQRALWRDLGDFRRWGGILVLHPGMKPRLGRAGFPPESMITVRNPVVPYSPTRIPAEDNRRLLYVGRLEPDKGVGELAAAAARTGTPLTMVGDGPMRADLAETRPDITLTGWLDPDGIGAVAASARALVMASRHAEPFALVIAEAAASGLPVLASDTALMAREVEENGLGFAFDAFDPDSLDAAIRRIMDMPDDRLREMSLRGASGQARLGLDHDAWIDALEVQYDRVARGLRS